MISTKKFLEYQLNAERRVSELEKALREEQFKRKEQEVEYRLELQAVLHTKETEIASLKRQLEVRVFTEEEKDETERRKKQAGTLLAYCEDRETLEKLGFTFNAEGVNA